MLVAEDTQAVWDIQAVWDTQAAEAMWVLLDTLAAEVILEV